MSGAPLITDVKKSADEGCAVCRLVEEMVGEALTRELDEVRKYAKIKVRGSSAKKHRESLSLVLSGRIRIGLTLSNISKVDKIWMKTAIGRPWEPVGVPIELYCAEGKQNRSKCNRGYLCQAMLL